MIVFVFTHTSGSMTVQKGIQCLGCQCGVCGSCPVAPKAEVEVAL